jgi:hypothetical protein
MKVALRILASLYSIIVLAAITYAWIGDISMRNSTREHLLPDILLAMVSLPMSLSLSVAYDASPSFFNLPFVQLVFLTLCGTIQASCMWLLFKFVGRTHAR